MTFSAWDIFALHVKLSFLVVHVLRNDWYMGGIVIWAILTMIPGSWQWSEQHVLGVEVTYVQVGTYPFLISNMG